MDGDHASPVEQRLDRQSATGSPLIRPKALGWHGGLTVDHLHVEGRPTVIECNPRTVEPANAAASGVDLPMPSADLSAGLPMSAPMRIGRAGVRTHGTLALLLGAAVDAVRTARPGSA